MLCKKKSRGINAKTAEARARKAAMEAERAEQRAWENAEAAWIASCPPPLKPSKAARRKEETRVRRTEALAKKAEIKKLAAEEQQKLETIYHTGRKKRIYTLNSSRPPTNVSATFDTADQSTCNRDKKGVSARQLMIRKTQEQRQLFHSDDHPVFLENALAHLSVLHAPRPSIPVRPHRPSKKTLYQASFVCVDA